MSVITPQFVALVIATVLSMTALGFIAQKRAGAILLAIGTTIASGLAVAGVVVGYSLNERWGGWPGLAVGILLGGAAVAFFLSKLVGGRSLSVLFGLWLGYCALCVAGYLAGGWLGLFTITLPAVVIFWLGLYRISRHLLPLRDVGDEQQRRKERRLAFRSLLTFLLGTNHPYYVVEDGQVIERVKGNPYAQFFAGPGFVITGCDHAAYLTDGIRAKGVFEPGLSFTGLFDQPPKALDLRAQLRAFYVDALSKDGIPVRVLVFVPLRIHTGGGEVSLGKGFPFRRQAVFDIVKGELVERKRVGGGGGERHEWDKTLARVIVSPIVQDIIGRYNVDELCEPLDPYKDPRIEIAKKVRREAYKALLPKGIEVIGGGISNLIPQNDLVMQRRLQNWRTDWERGIVEMMGEGKVARVRQIEEARAEAELMILHRFSQLAQAGVFEDAASETALALRFVDCMGEIVSSSESQWPLPEEIEETLGLLRGEIQKGPR